MTHRPLPGSGRATPRPGAVRSVVGSFRSQRQVVAAASVRTRQVTETILESAAG